jgi:hypothetical protein
LLVAAPLGAQRALPDDSQQRTMQQVQTFEATLQIAVKHGADVLAQKLAAELGPGMQLTSDDPEAKGFTLPTPEGGYFFVVVIPGLRGIFPYVLREYPRQGPRPVNTQPPSVASQGVPNADPMTVSPAIQGAATVSSPTADVEYSKAVANALIDAVIDNSGGLQLKETEWLTVAAMDGVQTPGAVNNTFGHTLYISVKGSDLMQYRQQKISRDELRKVVNVKQN